MLSKLTRTRLPICSTERKRSTEQKVCKEPASDKCVAELGDPTVSSESPECLQITALFEGMAGVAIGPRVSALTQRTQSLPALKVCEASYRCRVATGSFAGFSACGSSRVWSQGYSAFEKRACASSKSQRATVSTHGSSKPYTLNLSSASIQRSKAIEVQ